MEVAELLQEFWLQSKPGIDLKLKNNESSLIKAYAKRMMETIESHLGIPLNKTLLHDYFLPGIHYIKAKHYQSNPYYRMIKPPEKSLKTWQLKYEQYLPFQGFPLADVDVQADHGFREITPIGFTDVRFPFLTVQEQGTTWMSVTPFEIETMQPIIDQVKGHVLTLGLGLGYFTFMASMKPSVTHVTVIERDERVIKLFKQYILPYFPHPNKITIIHLDAYKAMKTLPNKEIYQHVFVDIYHDAVDGLPTTLKLRPMESHYPQTTFHYWLESSILCLYRRYVLILIEEQLGDHATIDYTKVNHPDDEIINRLYHQTKAFVVDDINSILQLLSPLGLKELMLK
jgi:hypothetical protein